MGRKTHFRVRAPSAAMLPKPESFARYRPIVDDWQAFRRALEAPLPAAIWTNTLKADPGRLAETLRADGIPLQPLSWRPGAFKLLVQDAKPGNHWGFLAGLYHAQEEVSLLPVLLLDPKPGERILDLCAAPGNKAAQIAVAMENRGTVVANDRDYHRIRAVQHMTERLGILNTSITLYDGANYPKAAGLFDRVLVDVPCTCEGTVRKSPGLAIDPTGDLSRKMSGGQQALLRKAIQMCRPGGRIVYASCTYAPEENEAVIDALLREAGPQAVRLVPARVEGLHTSEGLTAWGGQTFHESLRLAVRVWPHQNDTGGFFVAVLERGGAAAPSARERDVPHPRGRPGPPGSPAPPDRMPPDDPYDVRPCLELLEHRFGIPRGRFADYTFFRKSPRELRVANRGRRPPLQPEPQSTGMVFMRIETRFPKLTTAAAMAFGAMATRNTVDLDPEQAQAYVQRRDIRLRTDQGRSCTGIGYVIVRYQGVPFGIALYLPDLHERGDRLKSMFPKAWALR